MALISIILPVYNAEKYLKEAINSVLNQTYPNWELIIINDGSLDDSELIIKGYLDKRINYFYQENQGVSQARNLGLQQMTGDYFCFLDADDCYPKYSVESRLNKFLMDSELSFVDGIVSMRSEDMKVELSRYIPSIEGEVFSQLVRLNDECFLGNTWMIKREENFNYQFQKGLTHGEDLCFYLSIAQGRKYSFVKDEILWYRKGHSSAMNNLKGLEEGYLNILKMTKTLQGVHVDDITYLKKRIIRIMFLSWFFDGKKPVQAIKSTFRIWFS